MGGLVNSGSFYTSSALFRLLQGLPLANTSERNLSVVEPVPACPESREASGEQVKIMDYH